MPAVWWVDVDRSARHGWWSVMGTTPPGPEDRWGGLFEQSPRQRAIWSLRTAIQVAAREGFGARSVERPIPGFSLPDRDVEPLAGVRAAVLARHVAVGRVWEYAQQARADGHSWDAIAEALGVERAEGPLSRGERAYLHVVEDRPLYTEGPGQRWGSPQVAHWRCSSCGQHVTDRGPFEAAPDNNEEGHASGCARHAAEVEAYRAERDEE